MLYTYGKGYSHQKLLPILLPMAPKRRRFGPKKNKTTSFWFFEQTRLLVEQRRFDFFAPKRHYFGAIGNKITHTWNYKLWSVVYYQVLHHLNYFTAYMAT